ncbi:MAG: DUF3795 domain-containing protein [Dehalococcoidales bacterium]
MKNTMEEVLIAPCGMNCAVCAGYLALKNDVKSKGLGRVYVAYCAGCRPRGKNCAFLKKRCDRLMNGTVKYCYECTDYPCRRLKHIDKRYRTLFHMSMIENLETIKSDGVQKLLERETEKWKCPECGGVISCHNGICFSCGLERLKAKKKKYRWEDE